MQSDDGYDMGSLDGMSDEAVLRELDTLIVAGRRATALLIRYLGEVEHRRLHLRAAASSMFDFCVRQLGMSEGEAFRRITAARLAHKYPVIYELVATGKVHLSTLVLLRDFLSPANHAELLKQVERRSKAEVQLTLATLSPRPDVPLRVTKVPSRMEPLAPGRYRVEFTAGARFKQKLELALDLASHANPNRDVEVVLERGLDLLIAELERRKFGKLKRSEPRRPEHVTAEHAEPDQATPATGSTTDAAPESRSSGNHLPQQTRREVVARDGLRCSYVDARGRRCTARAFLEFDHRRPRALDGGSEAHNVRLLCRQHNRLAAEEVFGRTQIEERIEARRKTKQPTVG